MKLIAGCFESLGVLVQREIGQVHVVVLDVVGIGLFVVVSAKAGQSFIAQVGFDRINSPNQYVEPAIELLLVENERIVHVTLDEVLVVEG